MILLALACSDGSVDVNDTERPTDTQTDTAPPEDTGSAWTGSYSGELRMRMPVWDWDVCVGPAEVPVDEAAAFSFEVLCTPEDGWGDGRTFDASVQGAFDDEGVVSGTIAHEFMAEGGADADFEAALEGEVRDGVILLTWLTQLAWEDGGVELQGLIQAEVAEE